MNTIELKDNSHIETFSRYHGDSMNIVSFNSFNEPFDGHVIEYKIIDGRTISENDISLILGSPTGEEFSVTSNFNRIKLCKSFIL